MEVWEPGVSATHQKSFNKLISYYISPIHPPSQLQISHRWCEPVTTELLIFHYNAIKSTWTLPPWCCCCCWCFICCVRHPVQGGEGVWEWNEKNISIIIIELNRKIVISPEKTVYSGRLKINNAIWFELQEENIETHRLHPADVGIKINTLGGWCYFLSAPRTRLGTTLNINLLSTTM